MIESKLNAPIPIVCLMGPTASGKTALAVEIVKRFPFDLISVDSAMVYRGLDIGTAKPDAETLRLAPHRLIDLLDPHYAYSAGQFYHDAFQEIATIVAQGRLPLLIGGTMMYFRVLQQGIAILPPAHPTLRALLQAHAKTQGLASLHTLLTDIDPEAAKRIHAHDSQRMIRALELYALTHKKRADHFADTPTSPTRYRFYSMGLIPTDRQQLHRQIAQRFEDMLARGWMEEMYRLYARSDLTLDQPAIRSVGYRQAWDYLSGQYSYDEMCIKVVTATRQLAKRQLTWLRSWPDIIYFDAYADRANIIDWFARLLQHND
jgi:tRNA dimethylallyltransferase